MDITNSHLRKSSSNPTGGNIPKLINVVVILEMSKNSCSFVIVNPTDSHFSQN